MEVIVDGGVQRGGEWSFLAKSASAMGEGMVSMASGRLLSLFKVCGLSAICVSDSGRVDVWGRLKFRFFSTCALTVACVSDHGRVDLWRENCPLTVLSLTCLGVGHLL